MFNWINPLLISVFLATLVLSSSPTRAQTTADESSKRASALLKEAGELMDSQQFALACPKVEQVVKLKPGGIGARMALGECYAGQDRLASAWRQYLVAAQLALEAGNERAREATTEAQRLKPQIATITVTVPSAVQSISGLTITLNGQDVKNEEWAKPILIDAGTHIIEVAAPGWHSHRYKLDGVKNGESRVTTLPMLERIVVQADNPPIRNTPPAWRKGMLLGSMGVAALGLGVGIIFTASALETRSNWIGRLDELANMTRTDVPICGTPINYAECNHLQQTAGTSDTLAAVGIGGFVVAGLGLLGTVTILATSAKGRVRPKSETAITVVPSPQGIWVTGAF